MKFKVRSFWSNTDPNEAKSGWWWVYAISDVEGDEDSYPAYVGLARNLPRRLSEHRRVWVGGDTGGFVLAIATRNEAAMRRLETALIAILDPPNNEAKPKLSWVEREHYEKVAEKWRAGDATLCPSCMCIGETPTPTGYMLALTEPSASCPRHVPSYRDPEIEQPEDEEPITLSDTPEDDEHLIVPTEMVWTVHLTPRHPANERVEALLDQLGGCRESSRLWYVHESDLPNDVEFPLDELRGLGAHVDEERLATPGAAHRASRSNA